MKHGIIEGRLAWPAILAEEDDGCVTIGFRDIPQAHSFTDSLAAAPAMAADALDTALAAFIKSRMDIPPPSRRRAGEIAVAPDPVIALKALVYTAMRARGMTQTDMAEQLGVDPKEIRRMLDPAHTGTRVSRYADALAVCEIEIEVGARTRKREVLNSGYTPPIRMA